MKTYIIKFFEGSTIYSQIEVEKPTMNGDWNSTLSGVLNLFIQKNSDENIIAKIIDGQTQEFLFEAYKAKSKTNKVIGWKNIRSCVSGEAWIENIIPFTVISIK